mgnify:CR=1 FL=1
MTTKQFMLQYNMKKLVKSSQEYKEYMNSSEIVELQLKIDLELTKMEKEWKIFLDIYNNLNTNKDEFTLEVKVKRDLLLKEQQKIVENELEKKHVLEVFQEKLEMLRMNLKVYNDKEG